MRARQRGQHGTLTAAALGALLILGTGTTLAAEATDGHGTEIRVSRSFLSRDRDDARVRVTVELQAPADLRLRVVDFDDRTVRELFRGHREAGVLARTWDGRDDRGDLLPAGPYRVVASHPGGGPEATATTGPGVTAQPGAGGAEPGAGGAEPGVTAQPAATTEPSVTARPAATAGPVAAEAWITLADRRVYPRRPGFITVALDPGHGGSEDGAVGRDGTREADLNLDIGLRLARMLEGAGTRVVLTRTSDRHVNEPPIDLTGDGVIDDTDELAARPDVANAARADLFIAIHNNTAVNRSVGGPSTYHVPTRSFGSRSARLARAIQSEIVAALEDVPAGDWRPYDHGVLTYPYYVLRDYDPPRLVRPTQMPGVLSEGLFLSNPRELRLLKQPRVRGAIAAAYYEAIARYLAGRDDHVGYRLLSSPTQAPAGETATLQVEVRNQGHAPMRGWRLLVSAMPASRSSAGRPGPGTPIGQRRLPTLRPGQKARVTVRVTAPSPGRAWMLSLDARGNGQRASRLGSPMLQVPLTTVEPESMS